MPSEPQVVTCCDCGKVMMSDAAERCQECGQAVCANCLTIHLCEYTEGEGQDRGREPDKG